MARSWPTPAGADPDWSFSHVNHTAGTPRLESLKHCRMFSNPCKLYRQGSVWGECWSGKISIAFLDYGGREAGEPATGSEIHGTHFSGLVSRQALCYLPKCGLTAPPTISLGACHGILSCPIQDAVCLIRGVGGKQDFLFGGCWA